MFHPLRVSAIERTTDDAVAVTFAVPPELRETFRHTPGQHLNVRYRVDGEEIRRSYSICAPAVDEPADPVLRVGIRLVDGGAFSTYALKELAIGDRVEAMAPMGRFVLALAPATSRRSSAAVASRLCCRSRPRCWPGSPGRVSA